MPPVSVCTADRRLLPCSGTSDGGSAARQPIASKVGGNERTVSGIEEQDRVCLCQRDQCRHRGGAGGEKVLLVVLGHQHELEAAIIASRPRDPIGIDHLHLSCLLTCAAHCDLLIDNYR